MEVGRTLSVGPTTGADTSAVLYSLRRCMNGPSAPIRVWWIWVSQRRAVLWYPRLADACLCTIPICGLLELPLMTSWLTAKVLVSIIVRDPEISGHPTCGSALVAFSALFPQLSFPSSTQKLVLITLTCSNVFSRFMINDACYQL